MNFVFEEVAVPSDDPFKYDLLERRQTAEAIAYLLKTTARPLTLSITGTWGSGKTSFAKMTNAFLKLQGFQTAYRNAWQLDAAGYLQRFVQDSSSF